MSNINNIKTKYNILFGLEILIISVFSVVSFIPTETKAEDNSPYLRIYNYQKPEKLPPTISSIEPNLIDSIKEKVTITITGSNFTPNSVVRKNNSNRTTIFIDSNHLMVNIYPNDMYNQDKFYLTVFNSEIEKGYSNAFIFTIKNNTTITTTSNTINNNSTTYNNTDTINTNTTETNDTVSTNNNTKENFGSLTANSLVGSNSFMPSGLLQWIFFIVLIVAIIYLWRYVHRSEEVYMSEPMKHA